MLCQYWAERKRKLLIICPASLRKQWSIELEEKFHIPSVILEAKTFRQCESDGFENPFAQNQVIICSYQFLNSKKEIAKLVNWDIAIIDEAHKLRNAYRSSNVLGQAIKWTLEDTKKVLLTATPLQNSLMELFGLSTIIDDYIFGDSRSFKQLYVNEGDLAGLKTRLRGFCKRTLREQVLEYVPYTNRKPITIHFAQNDDEIKLYQGITQFLQKPNSYALPTSQKTLIILVIRKILASSSYALIATLETIRNRLMLLKENLPPKENIIESLLDDESLDEEELEEMGSSVEDDLNDRDTDKKEIDVKKLDEEIKSLDEFIQLAKKIKIDSKTKHLKGAIERGFAEADKMGAQRKTVVFTESRRTQQYLKDYLEANGYEGKVVTFNGTNTDQNSKEIYQKWVAQNQETGRISGSKTSDKRNALLEYFENKAEILIATESAAEGINLQFCSLVINYDLPWNPQRIEQRIGRCHRYGQKFDVVVINFLNERNEVDRRVYQLLEFKFKLFSGVFGASDEVLGSLESGVDFEKEVLKIYQECRKPEEIQAAFESLQKRMDETIQARLKESKEILIEHFDEDVHSRLKLHLDQTLYFLNRMEKRFWGITNNILQDYADFNNAKLSFVLNNAPAEKVSCGEYRLISKNKYNVDGSFLYRISHPLGEYVLNKARQAETPTAHLRFDVSGHSTKISVVEEMKGKSGHLILTKLSVKSFEQDDYLLFNAIDEKGKTIHPEVCEKLFDCHSSVEKASLSADIDEILAQDSERHVNATISKVMERNNSYYKEECDRMFKWADDLMLSVNKELKDTKNRLRMLNRELRMSTSVQEQHDIEIKIKELEKVRRKQRQRIFDVEDEIEGKRDALIEKLKNKMKQKTETEILFKIKWSVI